MTDDYDDWMDGLTQKERNAVLQGQRMQHEGPKRGFWKGVIAFVLKTTGLLLDYVGQAVTWIGKELQSLANRL